MALNLLIVATAAMLLCGLLYFEKRDSLKGKLATKPFVSLLFIATAMVQPDPLAGYSATMLAGFFFCLGGDVFLAIPGTKTFRLGLVSFLVGHVWYGIAFFRLAQFGMPFWLAGIVVLAVGIMVYRWLHPHLGPMRVPVTLYIIVISVMLCTAAAVTGTPGWTLPGKTTLFTGALLFYISDLFVARQRFVRAGFVNRLIGLPLYYTGQFLLAFSVGLL